MAQSSLKFGTSGLRGLVTELNGPPAFAYSRAFAEVLKTQPPPDWNGEVLIGRDLRASSSAIAQLCAAALREAGLSPINCGAVPTPALALEGLRAGLPAIMVTGSHIPEDRNGLKFYRADGEIDKADEAAISERHAELNITQAPGVGDDDASVQRDVLAPYAERYVRFFGGDALTGLRVGVYQHSSVARDLLVDLLIKLGAEAVPLGRARAFVPVDTEAWREEDEALVRGWAEEGGFHAIVSTDGDADRPLIADETGAFLRGDLIGALTARHLGADVVVTPVTSNSAIENVPAFHRVIRTRVGSPYVIEGMAQAAADEGGIIIGFEANGGVLLGSDVTRGGEVLSALPTRDAVLPILCALAEAAVGTTMSEEAAAFGFTAAASDRLQNVPQERSAAFVAALRDDHNFRSEQIGALGDIVDVDVRDGLRLKAAGGQIVHFRPSGNAPELRAYVEATEPERAAELLAWALDLAERNTR